MRNKGSLNNFFNRDRKTLYIVLSIVMVSILTLTVVYAALSTTLNINGNAEVTAASWDIHFDNIQVNPGSVDAITVPNIIDSRTINFVVGLKEPGDYYKFTVDIVNEGTIDAMIDSVVKTPELTVQQAKYIKYEIEYTDGALISSKQLLSKGETRKISVLVAYRTDVASSDIPTSGESLNLSFVMNYVQADNTNVPIGSGDKLIKVVNGNINTVGSEICIKDECFYLINNDGDSVFMLAKYNLYAAGEYDYNAHTWTAYGEEATGIQNSSMLGYVSNSSVSKGGIGFAQNSYWSSNITYPKYVYDSNSKLYPIIENYKNYLEGIGVLIQEVRPIKYEELIDLGCSGDSCLMAPSWVYSSTYWAGTANSSNNVFAVLSTGILQGGTSYSNADRGVRVVVKMSLIYF